jgi:hypothetical protein
MMATTLSPEQWMNLLSQLQQGYIAHARALAAEVQDTFGKDSHVARNWWTCTTDGLLDVELADNFETNLFVALSVAMNEPVPAGLTGECELWEPTETGPVEHHLQHSVYPLPPQTEQAVQDLRRKWRAYFDALSLLEAALDTHGIDVSRPGFWMTAEEIGEVPDDYVGLYDQRFVDVEEA